jgi:hypothetical protein
LIAEQLSGLDEKVDAVERRLSEVEAVDGRLEEAADHFP